MAELSTSIPLPVPETDDLGRYLEDTITIDWQTPSVGECARRLLAGFAEASAEARIERLFTYVRDEIAHSFDLDDGADGDGESGGGEANREPRASRDPRSVRSPHRAVLPSPAPFLARGIACRASEVLALGHGLCFAKSHLLVALLRFAGHAAGFCYARLVDDDRPGRFVLHGFVACLEPTRATWVLLDPRGNRDLPGRGGGSRPGHSEADSVAAAAPIASVCRFDPPYSLACAPDPERGESLLPFIYKRPAKRIVEFLERVTDRAAMRRSLPDSIG